MIVTKKICMLFFSPVEFLTWDNVEDQAGPHGPRWLHSQYWAGPQRCREWWMKTAVWSSPLPEDRSKWLRLCLHIWAEEVVGTWGLGRYKQSHFHKTHTLGEKQNIGKIPMTLVRHVECVAIYYSLHTILWNWANCCNTIQLSLLCQNAHAAKALWPGTTMCQMPEETIRELELDWPDCSSFEQLRDPAANSSELVQDSFLIFLLKQQDTKRKKWQLWKLFPEWTGPTSLVIISNVHAPLA